ncbi:B12-binding domain-containing radical SAM protein [[Eubacterium] cellulosolvens]
MDVLFIHPPVNFDLGRNPAQASLYVGYGMLHIVACLYQRGFRVALWNLEAFRGGISEEAIQRRAKMCNPSVIGIELNWVNFSKGALQTARILKEVCPDTPIIFGGTHSTLFAEEIIQKYHSTVDAVLKGEAEKTFPKLVENIEKAGTFGEVGGLVTFENNSVHKIPNTKSDLYQNIDDIPPYSFRFLARSPQTDLSISPISPMSINTCRGPCDFKCIYCVARSLKTLSGRVSISFHSKEWIINQINVLMEEGAEEFAFQDYLFLIGKNKLIELASAIRKEKIQERILGFNMTAFPGIFDADLLKEISKAGVYSIDYGIETGSNRVLRKIGRPYSKEEVLESVKTTISKGIIPFTWWMTGFPDEKNEDIIETSELIRKTIEIGAIPRWITPLVVFPGTELFEKAQQFGIKLRLKSFQDFSIFSDLEEKAYSWHPEAISHETKFQNPHDILKNTLYLKRKIFNSRKMIVKNFLEEHVKAIISHHPKINSEMIENLVERSVNSILRTFF